MGEVLDERNDQAPMNNEYPLMAFIANEGVSPKGSRYDRSALVKDQKNKLYKKTEFGDFIYSSNNLESGSIGLNKYGKASLSPVYNIFKLRDNSDSGFLGNRLIREDLINSMIKYRQGVIYGQWRVPVYEFLNIKVLIPILEEQRKVGAIIEILESLITLEQEKHKKLICLFNQLYTNIFSERLRDLSKEYSKVKLSDIIFPHDERAEDNSYPLLSSTLSGIFLQSEYFDNNTASSDIYNYKVVPNGYFTYRSMSDTGKFKINLQNIVEKGIVSPAYPVFKLSDNVNKVYFEKYIEYCPETQYKISVAAQGGTRLALPFTKLQDIEIFLHTPEDQENISDLIKLIDKIILLSENKTLKLQLLKQFLLNNLFI